VTYDLRHAAVSTWLNAEVAPAQVAEWPGHTTDVSLPFYAKCIAGQQDEAKRRIFEATKPVPAQDDAAGDGEPHTPASKEPEVVRQSEVSAGGGESRFRLSPYG
jgi:hypothetical protein